MLPGWLWYNRRVDERREARATPPMGVIGCLTAGFEIVARRPILLTLPLLLDLFLWLGPRLSPAPLFAQLASTVQQGSATVEIPGGGVQLYTTLQEVLRELSQRYNLFVALNPMPLLGVPTLMAHRMPISWPLAGSRPTITVGSWFFLLGWLVLLAGVGMGLGAVYLHLIGRGVKEESEVSLPGPKRVAAIWYDLLRLLLFLGGGALGVTALNAMILALVSPFSLMAGLLAVTSTAALAMLVGFHMAFVTPSLVLLRRPLGQAVRESVLLIRGDLVNSGLLILAVLVIWRGMNVVWSLPSPSSWTTLVGISGHAYVATSLTTTLFIFYRERLEFLRRLEEWLAAPELPAHPIAGK